MFHYQQDTLYCEAVSLETLASTYGTPLYVYSVAAIDAAVAAYQHGLADIDHLICFAVKSNDNLHILRHLQQQNIGFDIVSGGELARVLHAGGDARRVVFSGVGKTYAEIAQALEVGVRVINIESAAELERIAEVAAHHRVVAPLAVRVNPHVDAATHRYIATGLAESKFGIAITDALPMYRHIVEHQWLTATGIACHIGSQIATLAPFARAIQSVIDCLYRLRDDGISLTHIDVGGGLGIRYADVDDDGIPTIAAYCKQLVALLSSLDMTVIIEPGRSIIGEAGALLTHVEYIKRTSAKQFVICDAAMNDLLRPALYDGRHAVWPLRRRDDVSPAKYDVVGAICESGDVLAREQTLAVTAGDYLALMQAGAYCFVMSSQYNARPRAAEVLVDGAEHRVIRRRESVEDLWRGEL